MGNTCGDRKKKTGQNGFREIDVCEYNSSVPENNFKRGCKDVRFDSAELSKYPQNVSETTKYNLVTFLPKSLWFQFKKYTNIYFGLLLIPACFPSIAAYGLDSQLPPFLFILLVALVREGVEDFRRHKSDREFNKSPCKIIRYNKSINTVWRNIVVGDIVVLRNDERIPADMIVLGTSNSDGRCYMETSTLDGEKSLKPREALKKPAWSQVKLEIDEEGRVTSEIDAHYRLFLPKPTYDLNDFNSGYVHFYNQQMEIVDDEKLKVGLATKNLLLKGAKLKNTRWVLATVAYTGAETKIQLNATSAKFKTSQMEMKLHKMVVAIFAGQIAISIFCSFGRPILNLIFAINFKITAFLGFVGETPQNIESADGIVSNLMDGFRYFLLLNTLIPISLIVNLEVLRVVQAVFFKGNYTLHNIERDIGCTANTASVNEELGQIEYILSDKTGTLTQNKMTLRGLFIGNQIFGGELRDDPLLGKTRFYSYSELQKKGMRVVAPTEEEFDTNLGNLLKSHLQTQLPCRKFMLANPEGDSIRPPWEKYDKGSFLHNASLKIKLNDEQKSMSHILPEQPSKVFEHSKSAYPTNPLMDQSLSAIPDRNFDSVNTVNFNSLFAAGQRGPPLKQIEEPSTLATNFTSASAVKPGAGLADLSLMSLLKDLNPDSGEATQNKASPNHPFEPHLTTYQELTEEFLLAAAICHECVIEVDVSQRINYHGPSPDEIAICKGVSNIGVVFANRDIDGSACVKMHHGDRNIKILMSFPFDSERKRMSIITEQDGVYKLYIKGADSEIIQRLCLSQPQPFLEKTQKALDDFSVSGLRTLVYAMKVLSKAEFETYWKQFNQAQISNNKQKQLAELSNYMDRNLFLIGCTAIEDNLQDKVPESIQRFYEANIRVWMITGDKLETAENIARCAGIITPGTEAFRFKLNTDSSQEFVDKIKKLKREVQSAPDDARKAIVIDTARLDPMFRRYAKDAYLDQNDKDLKQASLMLQQMLLDMDAVVCTRAIPKFKAKLVKMVKQSGKVVLAIGDGANDVHMLTEANVGVGLHGEEGMQAVQAGDYAISNFKYLWKLIFVHGHYNHIRTETFINFFFYKNFVFTLPQFIFGFLNFFSGSPLFDGNWASGYNLFFTALPISCAAIFEKDVTFEYFMTEEERDEHYRTQDFTGVGCDGSHIPTSMLRDMPNIKKNFHLLYYTTQKSMDFNWTRFFTEVVYGLLAAAILCLITFSTCSGKNIHHLDGYSYDFWMSSFTIYGCLIFMSNVSILCRISQISWFQILWIMIGSIIPFYALSILFDTTLSLENGSQYFLISMSQTYHYYLVLVANITVTFILEVSRRIADTYFRPRLSDYFKYLINHGLEADSRWFTKERMEVYRKDHNPIKKKPRRASFSAEPHPAVVDVNPVGLELKPLEVDGNAQRVSEQNGPTLVRDNELNNGIPRHGVTHTENSLLLRGVSHEEYERPIPDELGQQHATHSRKPSQLGPNKAVSPGVQDTKLESVLASKFSNMHDETPQLKRAEIQSNEEEIDLNQGGDPKSPQIDFNHSSSRQALIREKKRSSTYSQRLKLDLKEKEQPAFKEDKKTKSPGHTPGKTASQEKLYNLLLMSDTESKDSQPKMELMEPEARSLPDSSEADKKPKPTIGKLKLDPKLPVSAFSKNKPPTLLVSSAEISKQPPKLVLGDRSPQLPPTPKEESRIMSLAPTPLQQIGGTKGEPGFEPAESVYKLDNLEDSRFALDRLRGESAVFIGSVEQTPARIGRRSDDEPNEANRLKLTKSKQESKIDVNNASFSMDG